MSLPAFATIEQLTARFTVTDDEDRTQAALDDASVEIRSVAGVTFVTDDTLDFSGYPSWAEAALVKVCCAAAARALTNPEGEQSETIGSYSHSLANASADVYLGANEKRLVRRAAGRTGLGTVTTTTGYDDMDTQYLEVSPAGEPMPWLQGPVGY